MPMRSTQEITQQVQELGQWISPLREQIGHVVIGQKYLVDRLLLGLLANGHILLEGVPGLAKTLTVKTMAACIQTGFQRLQFTPDLLPADLIGTLIYNPRSGEFTTKLGPLFSNLILADEINRAPAKVQSALLEAMQERQVTIGDKTYPLADPFLVLATQNPLEQEGTYQLPEAQLDRFMLKLNVGYPAKTEERRILDLMATSAPDLHVDPVVAPEQVITARELVNQIYIDDRVKDYIVDVVWATREPASYRLEARRLGPLRRFAARDDLPRARRARPRVPQRPRLRHAAGHQKHRAGCPAPSHHRELRSRSGERDKRDGNRSDFRRAAGAVIGGVTINAQDRHPERSAAQSRDPVAQPETS